MYQDPRSLPTHLVCPHCKRIAVSHLFLTRDDQPVATYHCAEHGDVIPILSAVFNRYDNQSPDCAAA